MSRPISEYSSESGNTPKLIFFDLDGTLIDSKYEVSSAVRTEIARVRSLGVLIAVATGRPYFSVKDLVAEIGANAPSVFFSGSLIIDPQNGQELAKDPLNAQALEGMLQIAREHNFYLELYTRDAYFVEEESEFSNIHASYHKINPVISKLSEIAAQNAILKTVFITDTPSEQQRLSGLLSRVPGLSLSLGYGATHPNILFTNICSENSSRARVFQFITNSIGLPSAQVAAFGDAEADIPFLKMAGIGVAMGNAPEIVKASASFVTASVDNAGVALALQKVFP